MNKHAGSNEASYLWCHRPGTEATICLCTLCLNLGLAKVLSELPEGSDHDPLKERVHNDLVALLMDKEQDIGVRRSACLAIGQIDHDIQPLIQLITDKGTPSELREAALYALGQIEECPNAFNAVVAVARDSEENTQIRAAAIRALTFVRRTGDELRNIADVVKQVLTSSKSEFEYPLREAVYIAVSNLPLTEFDTDTLEGLKATLDGAKQQENDVMARVRACEAVSLIGHILESREKAPPKETSLNGTPAGYADSGSGAIMPEERDLVMS